jgi:hypothetical protein
MRVAVLIYGFAQKPYEAATSLRCDSLLSRSLRLSLFVESGHANSNRRPSSARFANSYGLRASPRGSGLGCICLRSGGASPVGVRPSFCASVAGRRRPCLPQGEGDGEESGTGARKARIIVLKLRQLLTPRAGAGPPWIMHLVHWSKRLCVPYTKRFPVLPHPTHRIKFHR